MTAWEAGWHVADQSPYFLAVKAAHLSALVMERERCNVSVSLEDVRMFRLRAHEVATMAELAEWTVLVCSKAGCTNEGTKRMCPYAAEVHGKERPCSCCDDHHRECREDI